MNAALLLCAGASARFGGRPKLLADLAGRPVARRALDALLGCAEVGAVVVVAPAALLAEFRALTDQAGDPRVLAVVEGGAERWASAWRGLQALPPSASVVLVHDGARPLATPALVSRVLAEAASVGTAVPAIEPADTVRRIDQALGRAVRIDRRSVRLVQTPQGFRREVLLAAYAPIGRGEQPDDAVVTDDAALAEQAGFAIHLVPGERWNLKVTEPADLALAAAFLAARGAA